MKSFLNFLNEAAGVYAAFTIEPNSAEKLYDFVASHDVPAKVEPKSYHITTVYTRKPIDHTPSEGTGVAVKPISYEYFGQNDLKYLVLCVDAPILHAQHKAARDKGAEFDFEDYRPHISLTGPMDPSTFDISKLPLPTFSIMLGHEYTDALREAVDLKE